MISLFDILFLCAPALLALYLYLTWNFRYWKKRGIKSDDALLIFGSTKDAILGKKGVGEVFLDIYRKHPGEKVVGWYKFRTPGLLIRDPELVHRVLVTDFNYFRNNDVHMEESDDPIFGRNIFVLKDETWKKSRALVTPAFTAGKVKAIFPAMKEVAKNLVSYIKQHPEEHHVKCLMSRFTAEVVAHCAFGIEGNNFKESKSEMYEVGKLMFEPSLKNHFGMLIFTLMPQLNKVLKMSFASNKIFTFFTDLLRDVIVYRQENNVERNDLVQYLIEVKKKSQEVAKGNIKSDLIDKVYTDDDVLSGCAMFFVEGYETSALNINNILYNLALNKDVQENLRNEIDATLQEGELTFEKLHEMPYLNSVFLESNRILPAAFNMSKICTENYEMDIGKEKPLLIEKGTPIIIPNYPIHNDPLYWEEPHLFKPERFANKEEASAKTKGIFLPFGDGPRMCPGIRIATTMVKLAVFEVVANFEVLPTSKTPQKIQFDPKYFMIGHKGGIYLRFAERAS